MIAEKETLLTMHSAAAEFPNPPSQTTLYRWATDGIRGVKLRTIRVGGRKFISREAIEEFISALNPGEAASQ